MKSAHRFMPVELPYRLKLFTTNPVGCGVKKLYPLGVVPSLYPWSTVQNYCRIGQVSDDPRRFHVLSRTYDRQCAHAHRLTNRHAEYVHDSLRSELNEDAKCILKAIEFFNSTGLMPMPPTWQTDDCTGRCDFHGIARLSSADHDTCLYDPQSSAFLVMAEPYRSPETMLAEAKQEGLVAIIVPPEVAPYYARNHQTCCVLTTLYVHAEVLGRVSALIEQGESSRAITPTRQSGSATLAQEAR